MKRLTLSLAASEGLLELLPGYGAFVRMPDKEELRELFGVREALECYAVREAATRISPERIADLEACCRRQFKGIRRFKASGSKDLDEETECLIGEADIAFHRILLESSGNRWVLKIISDLHLISRVLARRVDASHENVLVVLVFVYRCHRRVLGAIRRGDGEAAARWMQTHMREGKSRFLRHMDTAAQPNAPWAPSLRRAMWRLEHFDVKSSAGPFTPPQP